MTAYDFWYNAGRRLYHPYRQHYGIWLTLDNEGHARDEESLAAFRKGWNEAKEAQQ